MRKFDKNKQLRKLQHKKNNKNTKIISIVLSITILVGAIIYFTFARFESNTTFNLIDGTTTMIPVLIPEKMASLAANGATDLKYDGTDTLGQYGTNDNNLRYIGLTPNNYIYYNCTTSVPREMNDETCEKWRIIGLFNNIEDEDGNLISRVKIIRANTIGSYPIDTSASSINSGNGITQWGESTYKDGTPYEGADLMRELNTDYLGNITVGTDGKWYSSRNDVKDKDMPTSTLNESAQEMIETVIWHAGAVELDVKMAELYEQEKGSENWTVNSDSNDTVVRNGKWLGKIGLMNISDFVFSTSGGTTYNYTTCVANQFQHWYYRENFKDCYNNTWLGVDRNWTMNYLNSAYGIMTFNELLPGIPGISSNADIKPVIYLKNGIYIVSGKGTEIAPYKLSF